MKSAVIGAIAVMVLSTPAMAVAIDNGVISTAGKIDGEVQ